jgi:hypothetical protein
VQVPVSLLGRNQILTGHWRARTGVGRGEGGKGGYYVARAFLSLSRLKLIFISIVIEMMCISTLESDDRWSL